jgi:hypothetical protein
METCNTITWYLIRKTAVKISLLFQIPYSPGPPMTAPPAKSAGTGKNQKYEKKGLRETSIRQGTLMAEAGQGDPQSGLCRYPA